MLLTLLLLLGVGVGFGPGNEMILILRNVEWLDLGTATTGVRFVGTLGTSVAAAASAALFSAVTAHGQFGPAHVKGVIGVIFGIGAGLLAVATVIATRLPAGNAPNPAGGELGRAEQAVYYEITGQFLTGTGMRELVGQLTPAVAWV